MNDNDKLQFGFSLYGLLAFTLQEIPYLPWLLFPPTDNPLSGNTPATLLLGTLERFGGIATVALLILLVRKSKPSTHNIFFRLALLLLAIYYLCWVLYFLGFTDPRLLVMGLSAPVPLYYFFVSLWLGNFPASITSILFFVGHTGSNWINFLQ